MGKKFSRGDNYNIPREAEVKVAEYSRGRTKITHSKNKPNNLRMYRRSVNNTYYDAFEQTYKPYKTRAYKTQQSLSRSLNHTIRPLLENNFFGGNNEVFVTLTYTEPMSEFKQLSRDYDKFWRKLCNHFNSLDLVCIYIKEMQIKRKPNSWHIHSLIKESNGVDFYIDYNLLMKLWGLGNVWINRVCSMYDYTNTQLSIEREMKNLSFSNTWGYNKIIDYMCKLEGKQDVFPSGAKIHGNKGRLEGPAESRMTYSEATKTKLANSVLVNENTFLISDDSTNSILNSVHNEFWVEHTLNKQDKN